ncbi:MAG TPA: cysteine synthase family protein [Thermoanaerobaculaceae bacterium]|nr:cysteine synthase family protein [Thermoanaerobaculaceae bacterium]
MNTTTVLDTIGNTPLIPLLRVTGPGMAAVLMKMEAWNPSGSLKDRIVKYIIEDAERAGTLKPHHIIIDASSGNTGIALAMVATLKGYRSRIFMPETKSVERRKIMRTWGTELVLTSGADQNSHIWAAQEAAKDERTFFYLNQNGNPGNVLAHYHGTGAEIWSQTNGRLDCFAAGAGTGGTLMGVARYLKDKGCPAEIVAIEPDDSHSKIEGLLHFDGTFVPPIWDQSLISSQVRVTDEVAFEAARRLAREEGIFCGPSTGAILSVALARARALGAGRTVVAVACDRGERYLSTKLVPD